MTAILARPLPTPPTNSAQHSRRVPEAARGERLRLWVAVARGKKQKAMPVFPTSCHDDVPRLMQASRVQRCQSAVTVMRLVQLVMGV